MPYGRVIPSQRGSVFHPLRASPWPLGFELFSLFAIPSSLFLPHCRRLLPGPVASFGSSEQQPYTRNCGAKSLSAAFAHRPFRLRHLTVSGGAGNHWTAHRDGTICRALVPDWTACSAG